jgi:hypothetical protein
MGQGDGPGTEIPGAANDSIVDAGRSGGNQRARSVTSMGKIENVALKYGKRWRMGDAMGLGDAVAAQIHGVANDSMAEVVKLRNGEGASHQAPARTEVVESCM